MRRPESFRSISCPASQPQVVRPRSAALIVLLAFTGKHIEGPPTDV